MEKSTIIRLRQAESSTITSNGDYSVNLKEGVTIEEGDIVKVHSVILDTATESVISIDVDTRVKMGIAKYVTNYQQFADAPVPYAVENYVANPANQIPMPDLKNYYASTLHDLAGSTNYHVQGLTIFSNSTDILRSFGGFESVWEYYEAGTNKYKTINITIPSVAIISHLQYSTVVPFGPDNKGIIISGEVKGKWFRCIHPTKDHRGDLPNRTEPWNGYIFNVPVGQPIDPRKQDIYESAICYGNAGEPISDASSIMNIYEEECSFILPRGSYEPAEIAQIFNDNMTKINSLGTIGNDYDAAATKYGFPVNNPFLTTFGQAQKKITDEFTPTATPLYLNPNVNIGAGIITATNLLLPVVPQTAADDRFIGANQVSMNYDTNLKKLNFDSIHFPIYTVPSGGSVAVPSITYPTGTLYPAGTDPIPKEPIVSYGGIGFTSLTAFEIIKSADTSVTPNLPEVTGKLTDLFTQLGLTGMTIDVGHDTNQITLNDNATLVYPLIITDELGKNITGALPSIDVVVPKSAFVGGGAPGFTKPVTEDTETSLTTPLLSTRTFDTSDNDEGYYLLDIGMKLPQKMIGGFEGGEQTTSNKIQAVIGKFYTAGNFLQSQGQGEIVYQHVGEPQMLNDLNVRILHPDFSSPSNEELGPLNSVFLEVVKAVKVNQK